MKWSYWIPSLSHCVRNSLEMTVVNSWAFCPGGLGGALHLLAVLVGAGGEHGVEALHALEALDGVGGKRGVGVPDVRRGVDVIDRRGEVVFHCCFFKYA